MKNNKEKSRLMRFLSNPVFSSISVILTVVALILAVYFYLEGKSKREFKYYCHPVKATVVKAGQTTSLRVFCENEKIESDVTAVQVAIWNNGKMSIRENDILEPITLYTEPKTRIIDVIIRKQTREVTDLRIDDNFLKDGFIPIFWRILEHNDGGIIQVIFAGSADVKISIKGIIEGQNSIKETKYRDLIQSPEEQMEANVSIYKLCAFMFLFTGIFSIAAYIIIRRKKLSKELDKKRQKRGMSDIILFLFRRIFFPVITILFFLVSIYFFLKSKSVGPPFGF
jgi:hypothetical protein